MVLGVTESLAGWGSVEQGEVAEKDDVIPKGEIEVDGGAW